MKVYIGNIVTCDKENHVYKYLVEENGRIVYVGDELADKYRKYDYTIKPYCLLLQIHIFILHPLQLFMQDLMSCMPKTIRKY